MIISRDMVIKIFKYGDFISKLKYDIINLGFLTLSNLKSSTLIDLGINFNL
jgi:hypothetical protein